MIFTLYLVKIVVSDELGKHIGEFLSLPGGKTLPAVTGQGTPCDGLEIKNFWKRLCTGDPSRYE